MKVKTVMIAILGFLLISSLASAATVETRVLVASDLHYLHTGWEDDTNALIAYANSLDLDYVFINGDYIDAAPTTAIGTNYSEILRDNYFSQFTAPYFVTIGNHERYKEAVTDASFESVWGYAPDYAIVDNDTVFCCLALIPSHDGDVFDINNITFLENTLNAYPDKQVFVILHTSQVQSRNGAGNSNVNATFNEIINSHSNVVGIISGHDHWTNTAQKLYDGCYQSWDGCVCDSYTSLGSGCRVFEFWDTGKVTSYAYNLETNTVLESNTIYTADTASMENWLAGWEYRYPITIDHTKVAGTLTDYPVFVNISASNDIGARILSSGHDIRFTSDDGITLLDYEKESFSVADNVCTAAIWVNVPTVSNTEDTVIYMYTGNPNAVDGESASGVWDDNYLAVHHMGDVTQLVDSTKNNIDNTTVSGLSAVNGVYGNALFFDGATNVSLGNSSILNTATDGITVECNIKTTQLLTDNYAIMGRWTWAAGGQWCIRNAGVGMQTSINGIPTANTLPVYKTFNDGNLHDVVMTYNRTNNVLYIDGIPVASAAYTVAIAPSDKNFIIGSADNGYYFNGSIDEVRLSNVARSAEYVNTTHNMATDAHFSIYNCATKRNNGHMVQSIYTGVTHTVYADSDIYANRSIVPTDTEIDFVVSPTTDIVNVTVTTWTTDQKVWTLSSETQQSVTHTIGDFPTNTDIQIKRDDINYATVTSNETGYIEWVYDGEFSEHTFEATVIDDKQISSNFAQYFNSIFNRFYRIIFQLSMRLI